MPAAPPGWLPLEFQLSCSPELQRLLSGSSQSGASAVNKLALCLLWEVRGPPDGLLCDPLTLQQTLHSRLARLLTLCAFGYSQGKLVFIRMQTLSRNGYPALGGEVILLSKLLSKHMKVSFLPRPLRKKNSNVLFYLNFCPPSPPAPAYSLANSSSSFAVAPLLPPLEAVLISSLPSLGRALLGSCPLTPSAFVHTHSFPIFLPLQGKLLEGKNNMSSMHTQCHVGSRNRVTVTIC